jgi:DNA-binding response OmpR family regulator
MKKSGLVEESKYAPESMFGTGRNTYRKKRMLIVEDSEMIVELLKNFFKNKYIVEIAVNGEEGCRKTNIQYFDIIISDISMPVKNGIEFYKQASKQDPNIGKRFLFYTGLPAEYGVFFEKLNLRYMTKPTSLVEIEQTVEDILSRIV